MPILDLYADDFPHGTDIGFARGCRGDRECTEYGSTEWLTCRQAHVARSADYNIGKVSRYDKVPRSSVDPGANLGTAAPKVAQGEKKTTGSSLYPPLGVPKPKPATPRNITTTPVPPENPMPVVNADVIAAKDDHDAAINFPAPVAPATGIDTPAQLETTEKPKRQTRLPVDDPDFPHGTYKGYTWGCRLKEACPGVAAGTGSCTNAAAAYQRDRTARNIETKEDPTETTAAADLETGPLQQDATSEVEQPTGNVEPDLHPQPGDSPTPAAIITIAALRNELAHAEQAARQLTIEHKRAIADVDHEKRDFQEKLRLADGIIAEQTIRLEKWANELPAVRAVVTSQAARIHELEQELEAARAESVSKDLSQTALDAVFASGPIETTGGGNTHRTTRPHHQPHPERRRIPRLHTPRNRGAARDTHRPRSIRQARARRRRNLGREQVTR